MEWNCGENKDENHWEKLSGLRDEEVMDTLVRGVSLDRPKGRQTTGREWKEWGCGANSLPYRHISGDWTSGEQKTLRGSLKEKQSWRIIQIHLLDEDISASGKAVEKKTTELEDGRKSIIE